MDNAGDWLYIVFLIVQGSAVCSVPRTRKNVRNRYWGNLTGKSSQTKIMFPTKALGDSGRNAKSETGKATCTHS